LTVFWSNSEEFIVFQIFTHFLKVDPGICLRAKKFAGLEFSFVNGLLAVMDEEAHEIVFHRGHAC